MKTFTIPFDRISMQDINQVGGKNASLGEMMRDLTDSGIAIPDGFAVTAEAFREFLSFNTLSPLIQEVLNRLDRTTLSNLGEVGESCRRLILGANFPAPVEDAIAYAYDEFLKKYGPEVTVAVRSSATAEDSPTASFAGQHETYLNVAGRKNLLEAVRKCYASLFNDRAIKYRIDNGFSDMIVSQSVGVQLMVRSDLGSAGVAFTVDPESGNRNLIYVTGSWGLGESVVQGAVNTDEFYIFKKGLSESKNSVIWKSLGSKERMLVYGADADPGRLTWKDTTPAQRDRLVLDDVELLILGKWCLDIEKHYKIPMDVEWAKDGNNGKLYVVQARPVTVNIGERPLHLKEYSLVTDEVPVLKGKAVGRSIVTGRVSIVKSLADSGKVNEGDIIVADITNPDWNALLKKAICIVTNKGGRTSHASIVARELGVPAVVGTFDATEKLKDAQEITVSCASGDQGLVYNGKLQWTEKVVEIRDVSETRTKPMLILADPGKALMYATYPNAGVGLLRMEFIIANILQIHPMALVDFEKLPEGQERGQIDALTRHFNDKKEFFVQRLAESLSLVAASFHPKPVIVRMSDFKSNEYARLVAGQHFEPIEENPMLGFRGASRYYNPRYEKGFGLECAAIRKAREEFGLMNIKVMIPFCRTVEEGEKVLDVMKTYGLERGKHGLEILVMAEIPSNILLAHKFARIFDGFSIGSNDLTQLVLGLDRDSAIVSDLFDENNEAVKEMIRHLIRVAHREGVPVGLCGQAPSDYPEFASFLVKSGIDSISFNPDALIKGIQNIREAEKKLALVPS